MARVNLTLPDELDRLVRDRLPGVNLSAVLRDAIRPLLRCQHDELACTQCGNIETRRSISDRQLSLFFTDAMYELEPFAQRPGATAEGSARLLKDVAVRHQIPGAKVKPLPRPSRAARQAHKVREFPGAVA
jgi:hypothetical protein